MDNKKINYLVSKSYKGENLDLKKIMAIQKILTRSEFKKYLNALKRKEKEMSIIILSPIELDDKKLFKRIFADKKIVFKKDPSLIAGIKIIDNDTIYELNLKNTLEGILDNLNKKL